MSKKRANYDRYGDPNGPSGFGGGYVDMSDILAVVLAALRLS